MNAAQNTREAAVASNGMVAICREVNMCSGEIAVYEIKQLVDDRLLMSLSLRARANPELRYYVMMRCRWESGWRNQIINALEHGDLDDETIAMLGGIVEL